MSDRSHTCSQAGVFTVLRHVHIAERNRVELHSQVLFSSVLSRDVNVPLV